MDDVIFMRQEDGLTALPSISYDAEDVLQGLIELYPQLLAGYQMNREDPRRFLLVKREAPISSWSLDHLYLDQSAIPTLVEVKRSSDTRIRREVVGQMLDYAANGARFWGNGTLQQLFEKTCEKSQVDSAYVLAEVIGENADATEFWENAERNLQAGYLRLVFVADVIPDELRAIIEFLNLQMTNIEVYGIEVRRYGTSDGNECLVPRLIGSMVSTEKAKRSVISLEERLSNSAPEVREVAEKMRSLAEQLGLSVVSAPASLLLKDNLGTVLSLYPTYESIYFPLDVLWNSGHEEEIEKLRIRIENLAGQSVTSKEPGLNCAKALIQWNEVCELVQKSLTVRRSIAASQNYPN